MTARPARSSIRPNASRPLIMGRRGAVAAGHPLAVQAGLDVLRAGGHAADAAAAVAFALAVVEPAMTTLGGDGFYHVFDAASGKSVVFNGSGAAPKVATVEQMLRGGPTIMASRPTSITTPGMLAGVAAMHAEFGRRPWASLLAPAIDLAQNGFAATHHYRNYAGAVRPRLLQNPRSAAIFLRGDSRPPVGTPIVQRDLAGTLALIARDGPETFYRGPLARRIADGVAAAGGLLTADDLAECVADRQAPISVDYRGFEVRQTPPNSMGFAMLQALKMLERFDIAGAAVADLIHFTIEARKRALIDRDHYAGDPRFTEVPVAALLSAAAIDGHVAAIDPRRAAFRAGGLVDDGDTSYFCVVDREGNGVSAIQSISGLFGCGLIAGDTGVVMNSRMTYWHLEDGHPNRLVPGKRVRHTLTAPMVLRDGRLLCLFGTPGGDNQLLIQLQALARMIDHDVDPQRAVEASRWTVTRSTNAGESERITVERTIGSEVADELRRRGHLLRVVGERGATGSMVMILRRPDSGMLMAASDPRRDAWAAAW